MLEPQVLSGALRSEQVVGISESVELEEVGGDLRIGHGDVGEVVWVLGGCRGS